jgi:hypothetical protein
MLDLNLTYGEPNTITLPFLRSFMSTYEVGIRNREANSSSLRTMYVKAFSVDHADEIARGLIAPYDMIVKCVITPGSDIYGLDEGSEDADPLPILKSEVMDRLAEGEKPFAKNSAIDNIFGF